MISERNYAASQVSVRKESKEYWENLMGMTTMNKLYENPGIVNHLNNEDFYIPDDMFHHIDQLASIFERNLFSEETPVYYEEQDDFAYFYLHFLKLTQYYCKKNFTVDIWFLNNNVMRDFLKSFYKKLKAISIRTLINEIHFLKAEGFLQGSNAKEEYEYYQKNYLTDINYIYEFCENYPVMLRCILETIVSFSDFITDVLKHLQKDKKEIINKIFNGVAFKHILAFDADIADTHQNSKAVIQFTLDNGKRVIYKPHSLGNEIFYQNLINWLSEKCGIPKYFRKILERKSYGWEEVIQQKSCSNLQELKNYYTRVGVNLFAAYLLKTSDIHYENIIANGEFPVIIDLETLVGISTEAEDSARGHARQILRESVLYLGLLPTFHWESKKKSVNVSGINGRAGQKLPFLLPCIKNNKSSDISIEYRYLKTHGAKNLAKLNGRYLNGNLFTEDLLKGFNLAYTCSTQNKDKLKEFIKKLKLMKSRYLLRDTQHYSSLLTASYHPDFMMDGSDRNILLYQLYENCSYNTDYKHKIVEAEVRELMKGDIPQFFMELDRKDLIFSDGIRVKDFFSTTAYKKLWERLNNLSFQDMEMQDLFIRITMDTKKAGKKVEKRIDSFEGMAADKKLVYQAADKNQAADKKLVYQAAEKIGDRLAAQAIFNHDFTEVNWIGIFNSGIREKDKIFKPLDHQLYDGIAGVAIFFHMLTTIICKPSYTKMCGILDETLFAYTDLCLGKADHLIEKGIKTIGALTGEASLVYTYQVLFKITGDLNYLKYAKRHIQIVSDLIEQDKDFDILNGNAGVIIVLCNLYELTKEEEYIVTAKKAADILIRNAVTMPDGAGFKLNSCEVPLGGFSHGNSGISLAFATLSKAANTKEYNSFIEELLAYEESLYHSGKNNWADLREGKKTESSVSWCHGSSGILLSRLRMLDTLGGEFSERLNRDIHRAVKNMTDSGLRDSYCFCHGNCGNRNILNSYARYVGDKKISEDYASFITSLASGILNDESDIMLSEYNHPGFMTGISGIGYCLLGFLSEEVPDILALSLASFHERVIR